MLLTQLSDYIFLGVFTMARTYRKNHQAFADYDINDRWDEYWNCDKRGIKQITRRKQRRAFNNLSEEFLYED